jgi:nucleoside diphosphate kinase
MTDSERFVGSKPVPRSPDRPEDPLTADQVFWRPPRFPDFLSCFPQKRALYAVDNYFVAGWATLTALRRQGAFALGRLWTLGSVLFKADTMLRGNGLRGTSFLEERGFQIRAVRAVVFSTELVEHFWRYSLGRLSRERIELLKRLQAVSPSLYLIVESAEDNSRLPCSLRLTELKGQTVLANRGAGTLRHMMGDPQSAFFNFVHTADEPADLVRELGLLFNESEREAVIRDVISGSKPDAEGIYGALTSQCPRSDLDFSRAVERLRDRVASANALSDGERADIYEAMHRLEGIGYEFWRYLRDRLSARGIQIDEMDDITIAGRLVALKQANQTAPFPSCEARHWENHNPSLEHDPPAASEFADRHDGTNDGWRRSARGS